MEINVLIEEGIEVEPSAEWMERIVEKVFMYENTTPELEISLVITGQERIQNLNREYRHQDKPTDVLSFSLSEQNPEEQTPFIGPPDGLLHLGEVIISYPQAVIQAQEHGHSIKKEMAILIIHGILHVLGYDHEKPDKEPAMVVHEKEILANLGKEIE